MREALLKYFEKYKHSSNKYNEQDYSRITPEIKRAFDSGIYLIERHSITNVSLIEKELGYALPNDIIEYINLFWHSAIYGYYIIPECIILFSVIKYNDESDDDILHHKNSIIAMAREWKNISKDNFSKYLPIGWTGYSGVYILYEIETGKIYEEDFDTEGTVSAEPIADSLKELIMNLQLKP